MNAPFGFYPAAIGCIECTVRNRRCNSTSRLPARAGLCSAPWYRDAKGGFMLGAVFDLVRPLLFALDPERAHELTLKSLEAGIYPRSFAPDDARLAVELWGLRVCQSVGHRRGLRQGRARVRFRTRHGAGLRRGRHRHSETTGRQFAPTGVPAHRGPRADQSARLQQRRSCGDAGSARAAAPAGHRRRQRRRQQGLARSRRRLCGGHPPPL